LNTVHENIKEHPCWVCHRQFGLKSNLQNHIQNIHKTFNRVNKMNI
jgi:hypothetical protein